MAILFWLAYAVGFLVMWPKAYLYQYEYHKAHYTYSEWDNGERAFACFMAAFASMLWPLALVCYGAYKYGAAPAAKVLSKLERFEK